MMTATFTEWVVKSNQKAYELINPAYQEPVLTTKEKMKIYRKSMELTQERTKENAIYSK